MSTLIKSIAEQLQQEHQMIGAAAKELKDLVERRPASPHEEQSSWLNLVRDSLLSLGSHLKTHFAFEEFGGFMEEVVGVLPNVPQVERLKQDHQTILAESEGLCRMARGGSPSSETSQLRKKILHLLELLNRHEHAENELVQRVLMDDLGTTD